MLQLRNGYASQYYSIFKQLPSNYTAPLHPRMPVCHCSSAPNTVKSCAFPPT